MLLMIELKVGEKILSVLGQKIIIFRLRVLLIGRRLSRGRVLPLRGRSLSESLLVVVQRHHEVHRAALRLVLRVKGRGLLELLIG